MYVEGGGGEAATGDGQLGTQEELKAELGLAATALGDELGDGVAGDASVEEAIQDRAAEGAFLGGEIEGILYFDWRHLWEEGGFCLGVWDFSFFPCEKFEEEVFRVSLFSKV